MVPDGAHHLGGTFVAKPTRQVSAGRLLTFGFLVLGFVSSCAFLAHFGAAAILGSLHSLGLFGFTMFCSYTLGVLALLGVSWYVIAPGAPLGQLRGFIFGRIMREVAADILPFAQLGGFVLGVRGACLFGVSTSLSIGSTVVDLGAELAGQLLFTAIGLSVLGLHPPPGFPHKIVSTAVFAGSTLGSVTAVGFFFSQHVASRALSRISARWPEQMRAQVTSVQLVLAAIYRQPTRVVLSIGLHLTAWLIAVGGVWLTLSFMGARVQPAMVLVMESLVYLLRSVAFFVPGAIGVMEGGYVLLGPMFGLPAEIALSLALVKRGRDLAIGLFAIAAWQILEGKWILGWGSRPFS